MIGERTTKIWNVILHGVIICVGYYVIYNVLFKEKISIVDAIRFSVIYGFINILIFAVHKLIHMLKRSRDNSN